MYRELKFSVLRRIVFVPLFLLVVFNLCLPFLTRADALEAAAQELAGKISSVLPARDPVSLTLQDRTPPGSADLAAIRRSLESALLKNGFRVAPASPGSAQINFSISETLTGYVWIADVRHSDSSHVLMVKAPRDPGHRAPQPSTSPVIRREFLWEQNHPILDLAFSSGPSGERIMLVLEPARISLLRSRGGQWLADTAIPILHAVSANRDPRGFLDYQPDSLSAIFEKEVCRQNRAPDIGFKCEAALVQRSFLNDDFLTVVEKKIGTPVSSAKLALAGRSVLLLTFSDGLARMYEDGTEPVATFSGWGSELVAIQSGCGAGGQVLVTGKGDWTTPDTMQAYEIRDHQAVPVTAAMDFAGPILSLRSESDSRAALAIVRNLTTHQYEAYHLSITCEK